MKIFRAVLFWIVFAFGVLALALFALLAASIAYTYCDKDAENAATISGCKHIFKMGGENSIGRENAVEILYSFESARSFTGDGFTFLKIQCKPEALARISKASEKPSSTWYRGDELNDMQKKAAEFAFDSMSNNFASPHFDKNHLFYFACMKFYSSPLNIYIAAVLMYDAQNHILYFGDEKI
ncbi:MAG: hypothetical protein IKO42_02385 [Opitutales bacterium]|nr:hypothetical protein [Opitutales bacterium]